MAQARLISGNTPQKATVWQALYRSSTMAGMPVTLLLCARTRAGHCTTASVSIWSLQYDVCVTGGMVWSYVQASLTSQALLAWHWPQMHEAQSYEDSSAQIIGTDSWCTALQRQVA